MPSYDNWLVSIPLAQLLEIKNAADEQKQLKAENEQLRREIEGLRRIQCDTMMALGDIKRTLRVNRA